MSVADIFDYQSYSKCATITMGLDEAKKKIDIMLILKQNTPNEGYSLIIPEREFHSNAEHSCGIHAMDSVCSF